MIKILGIILVVGGMIGLVLGVFGIFGSLSIGLSPWAFAIVGLIFFLSGIGIVKRKKDTDEV
ncbi:MULTISPECIES: hypothetical protein [Mesonia]|uniref:Uncharacterized protein n=1 Tax=Mesonia oceanica TaxID=2687242 RepID=A0AC61YBE2_9FLAO|nr:MULTISPECIES: hypothetical protein [Mesonia]MAN26175.1 hypothetical protein [Mesonia sp.]MAQ39543.1 hypothetical protein [Mesonia sp.]MBJ96957.1 hypothetical protein [Flavobacteriaceae bacterium]VVV01570.1 hypothetical protein FVB9532_02862 [Mesonia oceanica]|tara:strand:- start:140 stop:325 length:186 start_codon:yes stop_codon:yes gene_type:complete